MGEEPSQGTRLEINKHREGYSVRAFEGKGRGSSSTVYHNRIGNDPNQIAQVLLDLDITADLPIERAVKIYLQKKKRGDWLGI